jgi:beta-lactamase class A
VAIKDLDSGQGVLVNADREFPAASLFKLSVMYEIYRERDAGRLALADLLPLSANYARQDLGTLDVPADTLVSVGWALDRMITRSDNATANLLLDKAGAANVNSSMRDLGLQETRITGEQLTTSARDMLHLLEVLATEQGLKKETDVEMIQTLLGQTVNDRLPAQLPRDTPVAHKTGNLDGVVHDVGIVYSPSATLVFALLAADVANGADVTRAEAALTRAVYDYFNAPGSPRTRSIFRAPDASKRPTPVPPFLPPGGSVSGTPLPPGGSVSGTSLPTVGTSSAATPNLTPAPRVTSPPAPTSAAVATSGRAEAPTVAPPEPARAITAVRPTTVPPPTEPVPSAASAPATTAPAVAPPTTAPAVAPAITAVRPTAVPPTAAPAEAARPVAATPAVAPAAPVATAPRAPEIPRFGQSTPTAR